MVLPSRTIQAESNRQIGIGLFPQDYIYRNGIRSNIINPIFQESARPVGSVFRGPSGPGKTLVDNPTQWPGAVKFGQGFREDDTGIPWLSSDPKFLQSGGPVGKETVNNPQAYQGSLQTKDQRTAVEKQWDIYKWFSPQHFVEAWADNPVATLLFAAAALWLANEIFLNDPEIERTIETGGRTVAAPGRAASSGVVATAKGATDTVSDGVAAVVDTVEDVVDTATGESTE